MPARVLVTGGSGFLGTEVVRALAARADVGAIIVADLHPPPDLAERSGAKGRAGVLEYVPCDVTDPHSVAAVFADRQIDVVVHLAAIVNPGQDAELEYAVDVEGAAHVFAVAVAHGVRRLVVSSSGAAYGYHADNPIPLRESDRLRGNEEFPYSRHKRIVEEMLADYRRDHPEVRQCVLRIGTILGPGVDNQITRLWQARRILHIAGSDSPFVFIWIDDVAAIIARAAIDGPPGIYNVAGDGALTVPQIAARVGAKLLTLPAWLLAAVLWVGSRLRLTEHGPEKVRFLRYRPVLDNSRLTTEFGYTPRRTSAEAFDEYWRHRGRPART